MNQHIMFMHVTLQLQDITVKSCQSRLKGLLHLSYEYSLQIELENGTVVGPLPLKSLRDRLVPSETQVQLCSKMQPQSTLTFSIFEKVLSPLQKINKQVSNPHLK